MNSVKETDIKFRTYYFIDDTINIQNLDLNKIKVGKRESHTKTFLLTTLVTREQIVYRIYTLLSMK